MTSEVEGPADGRFPGLKVLQEGREVGPGCPAWQCEGHRSLRAPHVQQDTARL